MLFVSLHGVTKLLWVSKPRSFQGPTMTNLCLKTPLWFGWWFVVVWHHLPPHLLVACGRRCGATINPRGRDVAGHSCGGLSASQHMALRLQRSRHHSPLWPHAAAGPQYGSSRLLSLTACFCAVLPLLIVSASIFSHSVSISPTNIWFPKGKGLSHSW